MMNTLGLESRPTSPTARCRCSTRTRCSPRGHRRSRPARRWRCAASSPRRSSSPTCAVRRHLLQLHRQAARVRARRRPSNPTTPTTRCAAGSATKASDADLQPVRRALRVPAHRRVRAERDRRVDQPGAGNAGGRAREAGHRHRPHHRPRDRQECPRARFDGDGELLNAAEATGEIVNTAPSPFEGYWKNKEGEQERLRDGWVLDRRPRLPRRRRLVLLRRAQRRLDPGRRRELRRGAGRTHPDALDPGCSSARCTACPTPSSATG